MESEKVVLLELNCNTDIDFIEKMFSWYDKVQIGFRSFAIFEECFHKFSELLYQYSSQIVGLYAPSEGNIFVDTIRILSTVEDYIETPISFLTVDCEFMNDIKQIIEFYEADLNDGSLTICISYANMNENCYFWSPIEIIAFIERSNAICGITFSVDMDEISNMFMNQFLFEAYTPYLSAIYGARDCLDCYNIVNNKEYNINYFDGYYIKRNP